MRNKILYNYLSLAPHAQSRCIPVKKIIQIHHSVIRGINKYGPAPMTNTMDHLTLLNNQVKEVHHKMKTTSNNLSCILDKVQITKLPNSFIS